MESDSPVGMVPMIRNILGGFLFSGDDIYKKAGVLSGGERTRLAVARMLLQPANTLLLDEPTNHLDLDSKDVLLEALEDFGGTLIFVSHDRYFVDRLATKIIAVGARQIEVYPGTYEQFLWSRQERAARAAAAPAPSPRPAGPGRRTAAAARCPQARRAPDKGRCPVRHPTPGRWADTPAPATLRRRLKTRGVRRIRTNAAGSARPRTGRGGSPSSRAESPSGSGDQGARSPDGGPGLLRRAGTRRDSSETAPDADVGGRRPHEPVGSPPGPRTLIDSPGYNSVI